MDVFVITINFSALVCFIPMKSIQIVIVLSGNYYNGLLREHSVIVAIKFGYKVANIFLILPYKLKVDLLAVHGWKPLIFLFM